MQRIVCFTSDFGLGDTWVGVCHAAIHARCPTARVVDLEHTVPPFDVRRAAAVAAAGAWQLPDAVHLVVVDPGVGGTRHDLVVVTERRTVLVGPDNGVLLPAARRTGGVAEVYALDPDRLGVARPLSTFHARDVLAPAAAAIACGTSPGALGDPVEAASLAPAPFAEAREEGGTCAAEVVDVDRFGSVRTSVVAEQTASWEVGATRLQFIAGHARIEAPFARTFADVEAGEPVALVDASGWLTLAVRLGSAAERYGLEPGATVHVRRAE